MAKNATINLRVDAEVKEQSGKILDAMGLTFSDAFNLLLHQIWIQKALPFNVVAFSTSPKQQSAPKQETVDFIEQIESGKEKLVGPFETKEDLWRSLGI